MNPQVVIRCWEQMGLPRAVAEHRFCPGRKWRFDYAFPAQSKAQGLKPKVSRAAAPALDVSLETKDCPGGVAIEVQGGIWTRGRHTRGAALVKEWEKLNTAAALGWRVLYCAPGGELSRDFVQLLEQALGLATETQRSQRISRKSGTQERKKLWAGKM